MFYIKDLNIYIKKDLRKLIENFNFSIEDGDKVALIGEEGNGKSTLLKAIYNKDMIDSYADIEGEINKSKEVIAYLSQQVSKEELEKTMTQYLLTKVEYEDIDYSLAYRLNDEFELEDHLFDNSKTLGDLSGGERVKFMLLCELLKNPTILLLDEPSNDLDIDSVIWLEEFIKNSKEKIIFVSHDEELIRKCSNVIIHFEQIKGKSELRYNVSRMSYDEYINDRDSRIKTQTKNANKDEEQYNKQMERFRKINQNVENELRSVSRQDPVAAKNLKDKMKSVKSMGKRFDREKENMTQRPDFEDNVVVKFDDVKMANSKQILDFNLEKLVIEGKELSSNIELKVFGPKKIAIVGKNGAGKTSLLKEILKYLDKNKVQYSYMPQNYLEELDSNITPTEYLSGDGSKDEITRARTYLGSMNFTREEMFHPIENLSGGQKAKLFFIKIIFDKINLLILDEPSRNLSPLSAPEIRRELKNFGGCIISVSHDRKYIEEVCDELFYLDKNGLKKIDKYEYLNGLDKANVKK
ncbi:MAG: ATP-binding cassette domain-containing protein [Peptostreptococcus sp.]|uniref:ATP-binding cassette domain-containing protein n=1 Tax=Peptostreptococcus sp. TaxID=1262 RepID=UPI002FC7B11B